MRNLLYLCFEYFSQLFIDLWKSQKIRKEPALGKLVANKSLQER